MYEPGTPNTVYRGTTVTDVDLPEGNYAIAFLLESTLHRRNRTKLADCVWDESSFTFADPAE